MQKIYLKITQIVKDTSTPDATEKNYSIAYKINNQTADTSKNINLDFLFHADTAYNNNDSCEGYYVGGANLDKICAYSSSVSSPFTSGSSSSYVKESYDDMPRSFSVVDKESALSFSEKISLNDLSLPDTISIGNYSEIRNWYYYDNITNNTNTSLDQSTERRDLGFSLLWNDTLDQYVDEVTYQFNYGIVQLDQDVNLKDVAIKKDDTSVIQHSQEKKLWIQSGANEGQGMFIEIGEMNTSVLGIDGINLSTADGAREATDKSKGALGVLAKIQGKIGAQQNRLEHTASNVDNLSENMQSAESRIRDTDMAKEMMEYVKNNILGQAGEAMIGHANLGIQNVLKLIQQ